MKNNRHNSNELKRNPALATYQWCLLALFAIAELAIAADAGPAKSRRFDEPVIRIEKGMTKTEVLSLLKKPDKKQRLDAFEKKEKWTYLILRGYKETMVDAGPLGGGFSYSHSPDLPGSELNPRYVRQWERHVDVIELHFLEGRVASWKKQRKIKRGINH